MTGIVRWHGFMSLDGFIAGPRGETDWSFHVADRPPAVDEVIRSTGALLTGRRAYEVNREPGNQPYGGAMSGPIFVLTHRPPADDPAVTFLTGDLRDAVATALAAARGRDLVLFGADVAGQCLRDGLVDEILVHVYPLLLGDGIRLFTDPGGKQLPLELLESTRTGQLTDLRFRPTNAGRRS
ncbi:MAG: dihydrofolate reductase family protein [Mycobacteriales bacterium]